MVLRLVGGLLLGVHGFVHLRVWLGGMGGQGPDPRRSWAVGDAAALSAALAMASGALLLAAGGGVITDQGWWAWAALAGAAVSAALILLVFNRWLSLGLALDAAVVAFALRALSD